jgi:hypothetical protein
MQRGEILSGFLLHTLTAEGVQVFGRLHDDPIHTRRRQAYEKRQGTKSREVGRLRCGGLYDGLIGMPTLMMTDRTSRQEIEGAFKGVTLSPVWTSGHRTQPEHAGTDLE